ncbi:MAG: 30S ribosomal protein S15 [bacterium]
MAKEKKQTKTVKPKTVKKTTKKAAPKVTKISKSPKQAKSVKAPVAEVKVAREVEKTVAKKAKIAKKTIKKVAPGVDTGSVEFQISNFSDKIKSLAKHLKTHIHDFDSRRGLLIMVGKRRRLLNYIKKNDPAEYEKAVKSLKLKA